MRWLAGAIRAVGIIAQSGGLFVHMGIGESGRWSVGNSLTAAGAGLLAVSTLLLAYGVATSSQL